MIIQEMKIFYGKRKLQTDPCDRLTARIKFGNWNIWQIRAEKKKKHSNLVLLHTLWTEQLKNCTAVCTCLL